MFAGNNNLLSESGQMRLYKAYKLIEQIASKLSLPQTLTESAKKIYKIAKLEFLEIIKDLGLIRISYREDKPSMWLLLSYT